MNKPQIWEWICRLLTMYHPKTCGGNNQPRPTPSQSMCGAEPWPGCILNWPIWNYEIPVLILNTLLVSELKEGKHSSATQSPGDGTLVPGFGGESLYTNYTCIDASPFQSFGYTTNNALSLRDKTKPFRGYTTNKALD